MRSAATAQNPRFQLDRTGDHELIAELTDLVAMARATLADVLCHIAEVDARRLYLHYGCSSMFDYATEILGLSEAAALHRIRAARVARRRPEIFEDVAAGRLHIAGLCVLAPHLDGIGGDALLEAARGQSTRQIREMVAADRPEPSVPDSVTPVGEDRFVVRFTAGKGLRDKLEEAQALLSHSVPDGNLGDGKGGEHSADRIRVMCAAHNLLLAEADYGAEHIAAASGRLSSKRVDPPLPEPAADPQPPIAEASTPLSSKRVGRETEAATAMRAQVVSALAKLGFHAAEAKRAVAAAAATARDDARLEDLIRDALRQLA